MIPKIVYYCWFGNTMPKEIQNRIRNWKAVLAEYTFIEINEKNFDYTQYQFTKDAYEARKFAYVSDVARLTFLFETGGIYLDTDVDVFQVFDPYLEESILQLSMEYYGYEITGVNVGTIIAPPQHRLIQTVKDLIVNSVYSNQRPPINVYFNQLLPKLEYRNKAQYFEQEKVRIYKANLFCTKSKESVTIHHYDHSWGEELTHFQKTKRLCGLLLKKIIGRQRFEQLRGKE